MLTSLVITSASSNMSEDHPHENDVGHVLNMRLLSGPSDSPLKALLIYLANAEVTLSKLLCYSF